MMGVEAGAGVLAVVASDVKVVVLSSACSAAMAGTVWSMAITSIVNMI